MGEKYLIDTNILIYYLNDSIPKEEVSKLEKIFELSFNISILTKIEFLGWKYHTEEGFKKSKDFISLASTLYIDDEIAATVIKIKQENTIHLADAVIAATALLYDYVLITRNLKDFNKVKSLKLYNPFEVIDKNV
jgi:hypothetical protein